MESAHQTIPNSPLLRHLSLNEDKPETILIIHGGLSDPLEWEGVAAHLTDYHLILPDLSSIAPLSQSHSTKAGASGADSSNLTTNHSQIPYHASLVHEIVAKHAHTPAGSTAAQAHVVGFSAGATLALYFATHCPDVVSSLMLSGCSRLVGEGATMKLGSWQRAMLPYGVYLDAYVERNLPKSWVDWAVDGAAHPERGPHVKPKLVAGNDSNVATVGASSTIASFDELRARKAPPVNMQRMREFTDVLTSAAEEDVPTTHCRTLVVAATKRSALIPTDDNINVAKSVARACRGEEGDTSGSGSRVRLVKIPTMRHPWMMQDPKLFAETIRGFIEDKEGWPSDVFEELSF